MDEFDDMAPESYVTIDTSVGSFTIELYTTHAPKVCSLSNSPPPPRR